jgi:hypothetical protein
MKIRTLMLTALLGMSAIQSPVTAATPDQPAPNPAVELAALALNAFMQDYYRAPHAADLTPNMLLLDQSGIAAKTSAQPSMIMFYSCIFAAADPAQRAAWQAQINQLSSPTRTLLNDAMTHHPANIMAATPISPGRNDMDWGAFFATGDLGYVDDVIARLNDLGERKDLMRYVTAGSAAWSLASNARQHPKVHARLEALKTSKGPLASIADEMLNKPEQIQEEMMAVLKAQHQAGVW